MTKPILMKKVAEFVKGVEAGGGKPLYELTPEEARQVLLGAQSTDVERPDVGIQRLEMPLKRGRKMPVLIMRPKDIDDALPVIFYIHGGGWVMGDDVTHDRLIRGLSDGVPAAVVFPIYQQSPEAQFPQTTDDLFEVLEYVVKNADKYNLAAEDLVVAGDSVGGNMAAVMTLMAKAKGFSPNILFQLLFYPVTNADFDNQSYKDFADGPWLTKKAMEWFWDAYAPREEDRKNILACPLLATKQQLEGVPPALVITDENDVLRDEGEAYARKLDEAGVETTSVRFNGTIHDFVMLNGLSETAPTRAAVSLAIAKLQEVFFADN